MGQQKTKKRGPRISATPRSVAAPKPSVALSPATAAAEAALRDEISRVPLNNSATNPKRLFWMVAGLTDRIRAHVAAERKKGDRPVREICDAIGISATWLANLEATERKRGKRPRPTPRHVIEVVTPDGAPVASLDVAPARAALSPAPVVTSPALPALPALPVLPAPVAALVAHEGTTEPAAKAQKLANLKLTSWRNGKPYLTVEVPELTLEWLRLLMSDLQEQGVLRDAQPHEIDPDHDHEH